MAEPNRTCDALVVGAGPAGIAAACVLAENGLHVIVVDDNAHPGGQIWRRDSRTSISGDAAEWFRRLDESGAEIIDNASVFDAAAEDVLMIARGDETISIRFLALILATGARERFLPFPGWTLPNVFGTGGLQALVKSGLPIEGKRVVVAGTGPLLLAVAAYLKKRGAKIELVAEQTLFARLAVFGLELIRSGGKLSQAMKLRRELSGIKQLTSAWPIRAEGSERLERVVLRHRNEMISVECDYLACGFHLVPNVELAMLLGCKIDRGFVKVDEFQQTSIANVFSVGEPTGIGGVDMALVEGEIAGYAATRIQRRSKSGDKSPHSKELVSMRRFADSLEKAFALREELRALPSDETIVCRCEDVQFGRLKSCASWREAKLHTRCGMGPCQGRVCGPATEFLFGWKIESTRPPIFPVALNSLVTGEIQD